MRNLVDNMDLVNSAVEAVREPKSEAEMIAHNYSQSFTVLIKIVNNLTDEVRALRKDVECCKARAGVAQDAFRMLLDAQMYSSYPGFKYKPSSSAASVPSVWGDGL